jgi:hypothetical protein
MFHVSIHSPFNALAVAFSAFLMGEVPQDARLSIDRTIGGSGVYVTDDAVYKITLPREAATIVRDDQTLSPNLVLNSWVAFKLATHTEALLTGQLLLLDDEVDAVLTVALNAGLEVTGLASSSVFDGPHLQTLDVIGTGAFTDLAAEFRKCLDEIQHVRRRNRRPKSNAPERPAVSAIDPDPLDKVLAMKGAIIEGVYRAAIGTRAMLHGEQIGREMGMSAWISVAGTNDRAVMHGDFVATTDELQRLLRSLRAKDIHIVSIRNHTIGEHPQFVFIHFWSTGKAVELASAIRYALDRQVGAVPRADGWRL